MKIVLKYLFFGVLLGFVFPTVATVYGLWQQGTGPSFHHVISLHRGSPLYWIIDTAPFFLGMAGMWIGKKNNIILKARSELEIKVMERTEALKAEQTVLSKEIESRKTIEQKLIEAKEQAEAGAKTKSDFLRNMSHELRTPMNAIIGIANYLILDNPQTRQLEKLNILKFSAYNLLTIINNILDFSEIDVGDVSLKLEKVSLKKLLVQIKESHHANAGEKNNKVILDFDDDIPGQVKADPVKISQVLHNLLNNAIKFTQNGKVLLRANLVDEKEKTASILFSVKDTGTGISGKDQKVIFEAFHKGDAEEIGTGLGLAISKRLVNLMGSDILLESTLGKGTDFSFLLEIPKVNTEEEKELYCEETPLVGKRILLVEDNKINQKVVSQYLEKWGANFDIVENGLEAISQVSRHKEGYDLIIMDLQMPEMDGYETTRVIRKLGNGRYQHLPIIALTASALIEVQKEVISVGMNAYITKPFQPDQLRQVLTNLIH